MKKKANQPKSKSTDRATAKPAAQIHDLPPTDEQAGQAKGGSELKYNFGGIEGAASAVQGSVGTIQGLLDEGGQVEGGILVTGNRIRRP